LGGALRRTTCLGLRQHSAAFPFGKTQANFAAFPLTAGQTMINGEGKLEFHFGAPDNAAFFRPESQ
jgi:hypothetical protein